MILKFLGTLILIGVVFCIGLFIFLLLVDLIKKIFS